MESNGNDEIEIDLRELYHLLKVRVWIILLSAFLAASAAWFISSHLLTPVYNSTTKLYILNKSTSLTGLNLEDLQLGTQLTQDYMVLVKSRPVVSQVIENLNLTMPYEEMLQIITINNPSDTRILEITARYPDPYLAKGIVDEFAKVSSIRIANIMETSVPAIVEEGYVQSYPSGPNVRKNIIIGAFLGGVLSAAGIILLYLLDDTIKSSRDVKRYLELNTIGVIPVEHSRLGQQKADNRKAKSRRKINKYKQRGKE